VRVARVVEGLCYCHETSSRNCPAHQSADEGNPWSDVFGIVPDGPETDDEAFAALDARLARGEVGIPKITEPNRRRNILTEETIAKGERALAACEAPGTSIAKALAEAVTGKPNRSLEYWTKRNAEAAKRENGAGTKKGRAK
jgi:hypothetical protein